jgi:membrane protease YdiL (CAAX protease family)
MRTSPSDADWRAVHGGLLLALLLLAACVPALAPWQLYLLMPLAAYLALVLLVRPLRRTCGWFALGRLDWCGAGATLAVILVSSTTLVLYQAIMAADVSALASRLPLAGMGNVVVAAACFAVVNAVLEELIFRGVLYDAVASQWGWPAAVGATAVAFGAGHINGYPPGWSGSVLAAVYGVMVGLLRWYSRGLALPVVAHVCADATICGILVWAGAVSCAGT